MNKIDFEQPRHVGADIGYLILLVLVIYLVLR